MHSVDDEIQELVKQVDQLYGDINVFIIAHPSPRLVNSLSGLSYVKVSLLREKDRLAEKAAKEKERAARRAQDDGIREYDEFTRSMAKDLGITPAEFVERQEQQRARMERGTRDVAAATQEVAHDSE